MYRNERAKTQAFVLPKDRKTKDAIKHNTSTSLLRLPAEVRQRIWRHALGDRLIHIKFATTHRWEGRDPGKVKLMQHVRWNGTWTYIVCDATTSEAEAQALFQSDEHDHQAGILGEAVDLDQRICRNRHQVCYARYDDCADAPLFLEYDNAVGGPIDVAGLRRNRLPIELLRVCRQVYIEANPILWGTNIWSFTHSRTFYKFLQNRNAIQRRVLGKLHLDLDPRYGWKRGNWAYWWFCVLNRSLLKRFQAVHKIHIDITDNQWVRGPKWIAGMRRMRPDLEFNMLLDLRCLPLKVLTVACMETYKLNNEPMGHAECIQMAKDIHSKLLDQPIKTKRPKCLEFSQP